VLIAEREKYWPTPRRSPRRHSETTRHDRIRYLDGAVNRELSNWNYSKNGKFYKRAPSGYLIIDTAKIFFICSSLRNL
jgi:hypothetical protein